MTSRNKRRRTIAKYTFSSSDDDFEEDIVSATKSNGKAKRAAPVQYSDDSESEFDLNAAEDSGSDDTEVTVDPDVLAEDENELALVPHAEAELIETPPTLGVSSTKTSTTRSRFVVSDNSEDEFEDQPPAPTATAQRVPRQRTMPEIPAEDVPAQENNPPSSSSEESEEELTEEQIAERNRRRAERGEVIYRKMQQRLVTNMNEHHQDSWTIDWEEVDKKNKERLAGIKEAEQPEDLINVKLLPFQKEGLYWMCEQEDSAISGGLLADAMGMGKTIQTISLMLAKRLEKPTLVVCPVVALFQWRDEIKKFTPEGHFKIYIFHGADKITDKDELLQYDIVLTSYAIIESCFRKEKTGFTRKKQKVFEKSILHDIHWGRIVLDEAHSIKDRFCSTARAVFSMKADKKWSLTGTPLQNRVGELYSLIKFVNFEPYNLYFCTKCPCRSASWKFSDGARCDDCGHRGMAHFCWWNKIILKPIQRYGSNGDGLVAFKRLGVILDQLMLRRTKEEKADDLGLPPKIVEVRRDYFNDVEEDFYVALYAESRTQFANYVRAGTVLNNYAHIFELLSKLRQAVDHPYLVVHKRASEENPGTYVCGICHDEAEEPIAARCKHVFCREDISQYMDSYLVEGKPAECPVCFVPLAINLDQDELAEPKFEEKPSNYNSHNSIVNRMLNAAATSEVIDGKQFNWTSSTKIEALLEELEKLRKSDRTLKSIVFSQFVSFLDIVHWRLGKAGFRCVKLDGRMSLEQRDSMIKAFMENPQVTVFLISLKAGGVALNLTEASRVFLLDPWWNSSVEDQALSRIHRLGQRRPVKITKIIVENSIESRIVQLQEKKQLLFDSAIGKDSAALDRLSLEDLSFLFQM
jgi:DNA repair protein RAD16